MKILIIKPSALGDIVQALPVLTGLKRRWPAAQIDWVVNDYAARKSSRAIPACARRDPLPAQALDLARAHPGNLALGPQRCGRRSTI